MTVEKQCSAIPDRPGIWMSEAKKERGWNPELCQRTASEEIDGKPYCKSHAGAIALQKYSEKAA